MNNDRILLDRVLLDRVLLGRIGRAQGLKGEVRLTSYTQDPLAIADYAPLTNADGSRQFIIEHISARGDVLVARLAGIRDRTAAEALVHQELWIARDKLELETDEDEFLHADLIGCEVVSPEGALLGQVVDVPNYGAGDLLEIAMPERAKTVLVPFTKIFVPEIAIKTRRVVVDLPEDYLDEAQPHPDEDQGRE